MKPRENPFRVARFETLTYRFLNGAWGDLFDRLKKLNNRGAIVGRQGSGKTTLLAELRRQLENRGESVRAARLNESNRLLAEDFLRDLRPETFLLLDGAEQLTSRRWRRLVRHAKAARGLIITI